MILKGTGHHNGDPSRHCEKLVIESRDWSEVERIALLFRVLSDADTRRRLLECADGIEAVKRAEADPAFT